VFVSFNETTCWVLDKAIITGVCVPIICRGTTKTCKKESLMCSASEEGCYCGRTPPSTAWRWLADEAAMSV